MGGRQNGGQNWGLWLFTAPAAIVVLSVAIIPLASMVWMSLHEWRPGETISYVGLNNFSRATGDVRLLQAMGRTLILTFFSVLFPVALGLAAALIFHQKFFLRGFLRSVFILPLLLAPVAVAIIWSLMFQPQWGVLNYLLSFAGLPPQSWVYSPNSVIFGLALVETWQWTPLAMAIILVGLSSIPPEPYEAAALDGAGLWAQFFYITLPFIRPFLLSATLLRLIDALKSFDIIFAMTQGGPGDASETINLYLYQTAFAYGEIGYAAAIACLFFSLILALSFLFIRMRARSVWTGETGEGA